MHSLRSFFSVGFTLSILLLTAYCVKKESDKTAYAQEVESFDIIAKELMKGARKKCL